VTGILIHAAADTDLVEGQVVCLQAVYRIPSPCCWSLQGNFVHNLPRLVVEQVVVHSPLRVVEVLDGRKVLKIPDVEEGRLGHRQRLEEAGIPDHSKEVLDSFSQGRRKSVEGVAVI